MRMELVEILELGGVDQTLADRHRLPGEDPRDIPPQTLAARIRGLDPDTSLEPWPGDQNVERAAALLFATHQGDSPAESMDLLERYLQLLDDGYRPLLGKFVDVVG